MQFGHDDDALRQRRAGRRGSPRRPRAGRRGPCGTRPSCRRRARPLPRPAAPTRARAGRRRRRSTRSRPSKQPSRSTSHTTSPPANGSLRPSDRGDAYDAQLVDRERALLEDAQHLGADQAGRADDSDLASRRVTLASPSSNAVCSARTARSTSSSCDHARDPDRRRADHLDVDALGRRASRTSAPRHRGCVFMPAPTSETRPIASSELDAAAPRSRRRSCPSTSIVRGESSRGTVNEMSVWPAVDTFCTIMSTLTPSSASARNTVAATPGRSGTCDDRDLGLRDVVGDAGDDRLLPCSGSSSVDPGARLPGEARTHVDRHARSCARTRPSAARARGRRWPPSRASRRTRRRASWRASGTMRGIGGVDAGDVGVDLAHVGAERGGERDGGECRSRPGRAW